MKSIFVFIYLLFLAIGSYAQSKDSLKNSINLSQITIQKIADSLSKINQKEADSIHKVRNTNNAIAMNKKYPAFSLGYKNSNITNETLAGKVVFINLWFYSCTPCIREMDELNNLFSKYSRFKNFEFLSFTFETNEVINKTTEKFKIKYKIISIPKSECARLGFNNGFPTSIILDSKGVVKYIHSGGENDKEKVHKYFEKEIYPELSELF